MVALDRSLGLASAPGRAPLTPAEPPAGGAASLGDLVLTAAILLVSLLPLICDALGIGQWGAGTLGIGAVGSALAARALYGMARGAGR